MIVCIDGNDGTGKTSLIARLRPLFPGVVFQDRGLPTALTDGGIAPPADLYLILACAVATCQRRLVVAGKSLEERFHTREDLEEYGRRFVAVAARLGAVRIDAEPGLDDVVAEAARQIDRHREDHAEEFGFRIARPGDESPSRDDDHPLEHP